MRKNQSTRLGLLVFSVCVMACLCGCQHDPYADWFATKQIPEATLIGSYEVTQDTLDHFAFAKLSLIGGGKLTVSREPRIVVASDQFTSRKFLFIGTTCAC